MIRFFNPGLAYSKIKNEIDSVVQDVFARGDLILRKDLTDFERSLALFTGRSHAVGLNSGTDALYLALKVVGVKPGDEVIVSAHTFVASVQVIVQLGATPVLVDMHENWQDYITEKTTACIPCHIAGEVLDWEPVEGIHMIDDSCQALGAIGLRGEIQCWSFYPAKILGAYGDAGGITTDNEQYAIDIKDLGNHWKSDYSKWGINSRMDNVQAAILNVKLRHLKDALAMRKTVAEAYTQLSDLPIILPTYSQTRVWQDYIIRLNDAKERDALYEFLKVREIETMKNDYPMPVEKPAEAFQYESETLRLPCNEHLTPEEVMEIIAVIHDFFKK